MAVKLATNSPWNAKERSLIKQAKKRCKFFGASFREKGVKEPIVSLKCNSPLISKILLKSIHTRNPFGTENPIISALAMCAICPYKLPRKWEYKSIKCGVRGCKPKNKR